MTMHHLYGWLNAIVVFLLLLDLPTVLAQTINIEAARKEGKVIAYGTIIPQVMDPLHRNLEKKYGVKVEYWRASATQVMERARSEWQAGRPGFDVTFAINGAQAILKPVGVFAKYTPASSEKFPAAFKDKDGLVTAWRHTPIGVLYNTDLLPAADAPKTLDDLLHPKWKGKIALPDASRHTSTAQFVFTRL
jgi:ABC-type Fe3+ transport system substrate-binding protein